MASVLVALRTERSLSIDDLARRSRITAYRLRRIEDGHRSFFLNDVFTLARALRLRPSTLMKKLEEAIAP